MAKVTCHSDVHEVPDHVLHRRLVRLKARTSCWVGSKPHNNWSTTTYCDAVAFCILAAVLRNRHRKCLNNAHIVHKSHVMCLLVMVSTNQKIDHLLNSSLKLQQSSYRHSTSVRLWSLLNTCSDVHDAVHTVCTKGWKGGAIFFITLQNKNARLERTNWTEFIWQVATVSMPHLLLTGTDSISSKVEQQLNS